MTPNDHNPLAWLTEWYRSHCNGDWEHQNGIRIGTLDNPGWSLSVDLGETEHSGRTMPPKLMERSDSDWVFVEVKDDEFRARGGSSNLSELIDVFAQFVKEPMASVAPARSLD